MNENPFSSPATAANASETPDGGRLYRIALKQKWLLVSIGLALLLFAVAIALPGLIADLDEVTAVTAAQVFGIGSLIIRIFILASIFSLGRELHSFGLAILFVVLSLIPLIGIIVLLAVNREATKYLQNEGVSVGLLGADLSNLRPSKQHTPVGI